MKAFTGIFTPDKEDGGWTAQCAEVPSAITQGETIQEAKENLAEAILYMLRIEAEHTLGSSKKSSHTEAVRV